MCTITYVPTASSALDLRPADRAATDVGLDSPQRPSPPGHPAAPEPPPESMRVRSRRPDRRVGAASVGLVAAATTSSQAEEAPAALEDVVGILEVLAVPSSSEITAWVEANFTATTVGNAAVDDLTAPTTDA